ncbi:MAG: hypothetical protein V3U84_08720 [Thiotrichaceae bacterium]
MSFSGGWTSYVAAIVIAYLIFVFVSESFNPFSGKKDRNRHRRRLARSMVLLFLIVAIASLFAFSHFAIPRTQAFIMGFLAYSLVCIYPLGRYFHTLNNRTKNTSTAIADVDKAETTVISTKKEAVVANAENIEQAKDRISFATPMPDYFEQQQINLKAETPEIFTSEEFTLEEKLSSHDLNNEMDLLDQTIAEAEFTPVDSNTTDSRFIDSESYSLSDSENLDQINSINMDTLYQARANLSNEGAGGNSSVVEKLITQEATIESLSKSNKLLIDLRDSMESEVAVLKLHLKKSKTAERKSIAERDHAVDIKKKALNLATLERKQRQLMEIRERKIRMKLQNAMKMLTSETSN